jgi:hypothetical protein
VRGCQLFRRLQHVVVDLERRPHHGIITHHASDVNHEFPVHRGLIVPAVRAQQLTDRVTAICWEVL